MMRFDFWGERGVARNTLSATLRDAEHLVFDHVDM